MRSVALIAALPLAACSFHSGDDSTPGLSATGSGTSRTFAVTDFTGVALRGSDDVDVRVGTGFSVRAEGPSEELDRLRITRAGDTLQVGRTGNGSFRWGGGDHRSVKVFVTMPRIAEAAISGSGDMTVDRVEGERFTGDSAGSGDLEIATLNVQSGAFAITGSGNMTLKGSARQIRMAVSGSGDIDGRGLRAESAEVKVTGSGGVRADVAGPATVSIVGSGDVDLGPRARCTTSKLGSGDIHCGG